MNSQQTEVVLQMALVGLEKLKADIQQELNQLRGTPAPAVRRTMTDAGRNAIATAQKKRWAKRNQERTNAN